MSLLLAIKTGKSAPFAKSIHCDYIVTRNKRDFKGFGIPVLTPTEILLKII